MHVRPRRALAPLLAAFLTVSLLPLAAPAGPEGARLVLSEGPGLAGRLAAEEIVLPAGVTLVAQGDLSLEAGRLLRVEGVLVAPPGVRLDLASGGDLEILGAVVGLDASPAQGRAAPAPSMLVGARGADGGDVVLRAGGRLVVEAAALVASGAGGRGADVAVDAIPADAEGALAVLAGAGGRGGDVALDAPGLLLAGRVRAGAGGAGGEARADLSRLVATGFALAAVGGDGGRGGVVSLPRGQDAAALLGPQVAGAGGRGGDGIARSTAGADGLPAFPTSHKAPCGLGGMGGAPATVDHGSMGNSLDGEAYGGHAEGGGDGCAGAGPGAAGGNGGNGGNGGSAFGRGGNGNNGCPAGWGGWGLAAGGQGGDGGAPADGNAGADGTSDPAGLFGTSGGNGGAGGNAGYGARGGASSARGGHAGTSSPGCGPLAKGGSANAYDAPWGWGADGGDGGNGGRGCVGLLGSGTPGAGAAGGLGSAHGDQADSSAVEGGGEGGAGTATVHPNTQSHVTYANGSAGAGGTTGPCGIL